MVGKRIVVTFFSVASGSQPVRDWLKAMDRTDRHRIGEDLQLLEEGWPLGMPLCRPLGQGLFEARTNLKNRTARVLFGIVGNEMIVVHGFIKKSQNTPRNDLELARKRLKEFRRWQ